MDHSNHLSPSDKSVALIPHPTASGPDREPYVGSLRYGFEPADDSESDNALLEYWRILRRYRRAIMLSALAGSILGFLVGIPMQPVYRARTAIEVLNLNEDFMNMRQASQTTTSSDYSSDVSEEQTQAHLLQSDSLLKRVFAKLDRGTAPAQRKTSPATFGWRKWLHLPEPLPANPRESLLANAADSLKVRPVGRTRVIEATVNSKDPHLAADFANTLVQEFIEQSVETRYEATHKTSEWLRREIEDSRDKLQKSEDALQAYARESGLIFTDETSNVVTEKLQQLQEKLSTATGDRIAKQSRFELAKSSPPETLAFILQDPALQLTQSKIVELRSQIADLSAIYNPEYSKIKRAEAELATLESAFDRERADRLKSVENDYLEAARDEALLVAAYNAQAKEVTGQGEKAIQYNILKREVDSNRVLYDTMLQQTKQAAIASAMRASNVRIVDPAQVPASPFFPDFRLNSALGLLAGLFLSVVAVVMREKADRTLQQPGDIKLWIDLPELGTIPGAFAKLGYSYYGKPVASKLSRTELPALGTSGFVELMTWEHKPSGMAEAFRSSLTSILFIGQNGSSPRVIVFTSAGTGDGKTTVVSNLAIATAEIRRKVLVIDADLRRPRMHDVFNLPNDRGLSDLLSEEFPANDLGNLIQETTIPNLHVLVAGPPTQAAAHLLYSPNFAAMLVRLKAEYDMIFIDTPPALQMTDARVAGRLADAAVLVARANSTTRDAMLAVKERFAEDRIQLLGTILNDWDPKKSLTGYYGRYNQSYYKHAYSYSPDKP
jgi:capsular exopolysaccharide synthesis family protein